MYPELGVGAAVMTNGDGGPNTSGRAVGVTINTGAGGLIDGKRTK